METPENPPQGLALRACLPMRFTVPTCRGWLLFTVCWTRAGRHRLTTAGCPSAPTRTARLATDRRRASRVEFSAIRPARKLAPNPGATIAANLVASRWTVRSPAARQVCINTTAVQYHDIPTDGGQRWAGVNDPPGRPPPGNAGPQPMSANPIRMLPAASEKDHFGWLSEIVCCPFPLSRFHCRIVLVKHRNCARIPFVTYRRDRLLVGGDQDFDATAPRSGCLHADDRPPHRERRWSDRRS
ncbi:hypothetical protein Mycsm_03146 [Mycobacterium sp. JS623]|nr:hypothetical protein Mycsm_03146 [Mycobacterium sp. JS623]